MSQNLGIPPLFWSLTWWFSWQSHQIHTAVPTLKRAPPSTLTTTWQPLDLFRPPNDRKTNGDDEKSSFGRFPTSCSVVEQHQMSNQFTDIHIEQISIHYSLASVAFHFQHWCTIKFEFDCFNHKNWALHWSPIHQHLRDLTGCALKPRLTKQISSLMLSIVVYMWSTNFVISYIDYIWLYDMIKPLVETVAFGFSVSFCVHFYDSWKNRLRMLEAPRCPCSCPENVWQM